MRRSLTRLAAMLALAGAAATDCLGHEGPPYPILVDREAGPFVVSVWADPDVGIGTFFVILEPPEGAVLSEPRSVRVCVRPVIDRLPEVCHGAERQRMRDRAQYRAEVPFDRQERWRVRVVLDGPSGPVEVATDVEVTPPGLGPWDLALYLFPFVLIAALWLYGALRHGRPRPNAAGASAEAQGGHEDLVPPHAETGASNSSGGPEEGETFVPPPAG